MLVLRYTLACGYNIKNTDARVQGGIYISIYFGIRNKFALIWCLKPNRQMETAQSLLGSARGAAGE